MSLAENLYFDKSASTAFDRSNVNGLSPNPYYKERGNKSVYSRKASSFFVGSTKSLHSRWISPVEDGFDCVFSVKDNTLKFPVLFTLP